MWLKLVLLKNIPKSIKQYVFDKKDHFWISTGNDISKLVSYKEAQNTEKV